MEKPQINETPAQHNGQTINGVPTENIEYTWERLDEPTKKFILTAPRNEFDARVNQDPESRENKLLVIFREYYHVDEKLKNGHETTPNKPESAEIVPETPPQIGTKIEHIEYKKIIIDGKEVLYYVLDNKENAKFIYQTGLVAVKNKMKIAGKKEKIRYPTEKEAQRILIRQREEMENFRPVACFISGVNIGENGAFSYLSPLSLETVRRDQTYVPPDTTLFVIVIADEKK